MVRKVPAFISFILMTKENHMLPDLRSYSLDSCAAHSCKLRGDYERYVDCKVRHISEQFPRPRGIWSAEV